MRTYVRMAYPAYLREKARTLRRDKGMTIDELADCLALSRSTIYYWVGDLPIERKPDATQLARARKAAARSNRKRFTRLREQAYRAGEHSFDALAEDPSFRDFVMLFMTEGYRRSPNTVSIANSDPGLVELGNRWIRLLSEHRVSYSVQYHADQDPEMLRGFWANRLNIGQAAVSLQLKSNSAHLSTRKWRCRFGVMSVTCHDTYLRERMQAWMDRLQQRWLDSAHVGA